jgi:CubicO group peptidase (beta-lactamase class C family)
MRKRGRFTSSYRVDPAGGLELADGPDGQWSTPPAFPLGNGGLAGTADDWLAFGRMLLAGGTNADGRRLLTGDSVRLMTTDHTTSRQRGRYGWVGGTGTSAHVNPSAGTVAILLTQVAADSPVAPGWMREFWRYTTDAC